MAKTHIKKDDQVLVIAGKDRGVVGKVLRVIPDKGRAVVEGVNMIKRHTRPNPNRQVQGGIVEREAPVHISNLMVLEPEAKVPTRISRKRLDDGKTVRVAKRTGAALD
ncbi:MAG: 50S ribosomal protein L24 [Acidobacteria bacterium]|nr:50S ribosomal protein L24 [Acidobacteriota bacterium]